MSLGSNPWVSMSNVATQQKVPYRVSEDGEQAALIAETLKALAHPVRIRIVAILTGGPQHVSALTERLGVSAGGGVPAAPHPAHAQTREGGSQRGLHLLQSGRAAAAGPGTLHGVLLTGVAVASKASWTLSRR